MKHLTLILFIFFSFTLLFAQSDELRKKHFNTKKNIALEGYDAVSYFEGKPIEGKLDFSFSHRGISYLLKGKP